MQEPFHESARPARDPPAASPSSRVRGARGLTAAVFPADPWHTDLVGRSLGSRGASARLRLAGCGHALRAWGAGARLRRARCGRSLHSRGAVPGGGVLRSCHLSEGGKWRILPTSAALCAETKEHDDGIARALFISMDGARHYTELAVWRIGDQLRTEVFKLTGRPKFARDFRAQEQADDAVNSICRNIAEGFACETHGEFARYLSYSRRSLNEIRDAMRGARQKGYVSAADLREFQRLAFHLRPALTRFIAFLRATPDVKNNRGRRPRERPRAAPASRDRQPAPPPRAAKPRPRTARTK